MMKRTLLAVAIILTGHIGFAQKTMHGHSSTPVNSAGMGELLSGAKTTGIGSHLTLSNISATDSARILYSHTGSGSGYVTGTNSYNDMGFAERFDFNGMDSSIQILGLYAQFGGTVSPTSPLSAVLKIWDAGSQTMISGSLYYNNFPSTLLDSVSVPLTQLGIGPVKDTVKQFIFATPTNYLSRPFYAGYTIAYNHNLLNGDTIGMATTLNGHRATNDYKIDYLVNDDGDTTLIDTVINVQNATQWSDGIWYDNYTHNDSIANNLAVYPIVVIGSPLGVSNITRNNFTFFGSYPNPANDVVNIKYALKTTSDITVDIMDVSGHIIKTVKETALETGTHTIRIATSDMATGDYFYIIHTSAGDGLASKFTILK